MALTTFLSLQEFHNHKMLLGEAIPSYLFELEQLLGRTSNGRIGKGITQSTFNSPVFW